MHGHARAALDAMYHQSSLRRQTHLGLVGLQPVAVEQVRHGDALGRVDGEEAAYERLGVVRHRLPVAALHAELAALDLRHDRLGASITIAALEWHFSR